MDKDMKFIKSFFIRTLILLVAVMAVVVVFDPFYQYHKPLPGLKAILADKEYQCIGTLRTFDYDALIVGSSVCENYNNYWFDDGFGCNTIKAIRAYGATADLCYLLDAAYESHDLKYVFYNIDPASLSANTETSYELTGCPMYLYDRNIFNDYSYLLNKDVLMEKVPYMLANSFIGDYNEGDSYNWAQWKNFSQDQAIWLYTRLPSIKDMLPETANSTELAGNIALLTAQVEAHPDTTFKFFFSPYSMLWWDNAYRNGERDAVIYNEKQAIRTLLQYDNVEIYFYQDDEAVITNLDNYMDVIHFSKDINYYIYDKMTRSEERLTLDNYEERLDHMMTLSKKIVEEEILKYYDE